MSKLLTREKYTLRTDYRVTSSEVLNKDNDSATGKISSYKYDTSKGITQFISYGDFSRTEKVLEKDSIGNPILILTEFPDHSYAVSKLSYEYY